MYCAGCGTKLEDDARFCHECGKPVMPSVSAQEPPLVSIQDQPPAQTQEPPMTPECAPPPQPYYYGNQTPRPPYNAEEQAQIPPYYSGAQKSQPAYNWEPPPPHPSEEHRSGAWKIIIPIASVVVLLAAFACLYFFTDILPFGQNRNNEQTIANGNNPVDSSTTPAPATAIPVQPIPTPVSPRPPVPPASPEISAALLPGIGGSVRVAGMTRITFTPEFSGEWDFVTWDNGDSDPFLEIYDMREFLVASDDDSADNFNAHIVVFLNGGETYTIVAGFWGGESGDYTLSAAPYHEIVLPPPPELLYAEQLPDDGGEVRVEGLTGFLFTPETSGFWVFRTSDNKDSDPSLELYDESNHRIAFDDDRAGDYNALMFAFLNEGETYLVKADFWGAKTGDYTLTVSPAINFSPNGGEVNITEPTVYAFTPARTGMWEFRTSNNGKSDPFLSIFNQNNNYIAQDDDGGEGYNALISVKLDESFEYLIFAEFFEGESGSYDLTVS